VPGSKNILQRWSQSYAYLAAWLDRGGGNFSGYSGDEFYFASKEYGDGSFAPTLQLTSAVPLPAAMPLLLSGLLPLAGFARRRR